MECSERQEYTISYTAWEYDFEEWDTRGVKDNAMVILLSDCEKAFFDQLHWDCKERVSSVCKHIDKLLNQ